MDQRISEQIGALRSDDWMSLRDAVEQTGDLLRDGSFSEPDLAAIGEELLKLAGHDLWEVRREVAHAILHLRHDRFEAALARLLEDESSWVRQAAQRTQARRASQAQTDQLQNHHDRMLGTWLEDLGKKHGPQAVATAMRAAKRFAGVLVREIHHEIRKTVTPLDGALTRLDASMSRIQPDLQRCKEQLAEARHGVAVTLETIDALLELTQEVKPEFRGEKLHSIVEEAVRAARDHFPGTPFQVELAVDPMIALDAHRIRLMRALMHLIDNAVESYDGLARPRLVQIAAVEREPGELALSITDQGCGMDDADHGRAFDLFASSKGKAGTGVGLPMARRIIEEEHRGRIWITTTEGAGSTVHVVLPVVQEQGEP